MEGLPPAGVVADAGVDPAVAAFAEAAPWMVTVCPADEKISADAVCATISTPLALLIVTVCVLPELEMPALLMLEPVPPRIETGPPFTVTV